MMSRIRFLNLPLLLTAVIFCTGCSLLEDILGGVAALCDVDPFVVTKVDDTADGICNAADCSLREAVRQANACPGPQTIQLPAGAYRLTHLGAGEDAALTGDLDITDDLTILGEGAPSIHGEDDDRTIEIFSPATVVIDSVILTDGAASEGSAVYNRGDLTLRNSLVNNNVAVVPPGGGTVTGALANEGTLTLVDTQVFDNQGGFGAGVHNLSGSSFDMVGGVIRFNDAGSAGGGLWVSETSTARLDNVTIEGNTAVGDGAGIANMGSLEVLDSEILENDAGQHGGGLWTGFGSVTSLLNTPVEGNTAEMEGGGIFNKGDLTLSEVGLNRNSAGVVGGGLVNDASGVANVGNSNINENESATQAGGVFNDGELNFVRATVSDNTAVGQGGGILTRTGATLDATMLEVSGNEAGHDGGGIAIHWESSVILRNSSIHDNTSGRFGAAVYNEGSFEFERGSILRNVAATGPSAMYIGAPVGRTSASAVLRNVTISGNRNSAGGPAIRAFDSLDMTHVTITDNTSFALGNSAIRMVNTILERNGSGNCDSGVTFAFETGNLDSDGTCGLSGLSGVSALLLPLVSDGLGGVGSVYPLDPASPAVDAASDPACLPQDQRTVARPQGAACDIGAYELESGEMAAAEDTPEPAVAPMGTFTSNAFCRRGPSTVFPDVRTFNQGQQVELDARNSQNTWSRVKLDHCWTSNSLLDIEGPYEELPMIEVPLPEATPTPIPTPTPPSVLAVPDAPANLTVTNVVCSSQQYQVTLGWGASDGAAGYRVYRDGALIATLGAGATSYADDLPDFEAHQWGVEAFNNSGTSGRPTVNQSGCLY